MRNSLHLFGWCQCFIEHRMCFKCSDPLPIITLTKSFASCLNAPTASAEILDMTFDHCFCKIMSLTYMAASGWFHRWDSALLIISTSLYMTKTNEICVNRNCWWFQMQVSLVNLLLIFGVREDEPISYVQFAIVRTDDGCFRWVVIAKEIEEIKQMVAHIVIHWLQDSWGLIETYLAAYSRYNWY